MTRSAHRLDPPRVSGSRSGSRRKPPAPHPGPLLLLLPPGSHTSLARQGRAGHQARRASRGGRDRGNSRSWWPASPVRPPGGVGEHRRSSLPSNTRHRSSSAARSEEHTSELQSPCNLVCRLLLEKKKKKQVNFTFLYKNKNIS